jgi:hypothetical protein
VYFSFAGLIFAGHVLKDENTLATHNIKDSGIAVNMVRAAAKKPEPAAEAQVRFTAFDDLWGSISILKSVSLFAGRWYMDFKLYLLIPHSPQDRPVAAHVCCESLSLCGEFSLSIAPSMCLVR